MSGTGRCYDNARMESFFATLKKKNLYHMDTTKLRREDVKTIIFRYIHYYNLPPDLVSQWWSAAVGVSKVLLQLAPNHRCLMETGVAAKSLHLGTKLFLTIPTELKR